jgi:inhibitor of cysteine peptidase
MKRRTNANWIWINLLFLVTACGLGHSGGPLCEVAGNCQDDNEDVESTPPRIQYGNASFSLTSKGFDDCSELQTLVRERLIGRQQEELRYRAWNEARMRQWSKKGASAKASQTPAASMDSAAEASGATEESMTNVQESGVDEADTVKIGVNHIFVQQSAGIRVVNRKNYEVLGLLETKGLSQVTLYTDQQNLIVSGIRQEEQKPEALMLSSMVSDSYYPPKNMKKITEIRVYHAVPGELPQLQRSRSIDAEVVDTRFIDGRMVMVLKKQLDVDTGGVFAKSQYAWNQAWPFHTMNLDAEIPAEPVRLATDGTIDGIPCGAIIQPQSNDFDIRLTQVLMINTRDESLSSASAALMGGGDQIYMTANALYIAKQGVSWFYWDHVDKEDLAITKFAIRASDGEIAPVGSALIEGRVKDQWAFKEYGEEKTLVVASTTGQLWGRGAQIAQNHLWVLRENPESGNLDLQVALRDFGTGEDIRSVRFVGKMAYVVTFKKTDPLFAFDLSHLAEPRLLGELKIPGFSTYMHPVADGRILGVGFDALEQGEFALFQGVQISLFDVSNPSEMARIDQKVIGSRGSSSEVTWDHHAFYFDAENKIAAIPAVELDGAESGWNYASNYKFSGAILYSVGDRLEEIGRISHIDWMPKECQPRYGHWWQEERRSPDVNRVFKVDGKLLAISRFAITVRDFAAGMDQGNWQDHDQHIDLGGSMDDCARSFY